MDLSIVSYLHNNSDTVTELYNRLEKTLAELSVSYEIVLVNDGSSDETLITVNSLAKKDPHVKIVNFTRHYGMAAGLQAGFDRATGDLIFTLSPTLENHPEELPRFLTTMREGGYDFIVGCRGKRLHGRKIKHILSSLGNKLTSILVGQKLTDLTSPMRLTKSSVLKNLKIYGNHHLFLPALATLHGAKFKELEIEHQKPKGRFSSRSTITAPEALLEILFLKFLISATTPPFSTTPIKIFGGTGSVALLIGLALGINLTVERLIFQQSIANRPALLLAVLLVLIGAMFMVMGLLGELLIRIYFESQNKKTYTLDN
jgi:glycosyltransferase involved in cell wall biosynthesis